MMRMKRDDATSWQPLNLFTPGSINGQQATVMCLEGEVQ